MKLKPFSKNSASNRSPVALQRLSNSSASRILLILGLCLLGLAGCAKKEEPKPMAMSEAQKAFEKRCRDEYDMQVITRQAGQTLWIYLPTNTPMFDYEAQKENTKEAPERKNAKFAVQYLDGDFKNGALRLEYDIIDKKKSPKEDFGYNSTYTDAYIKKQNNLFAAISDSFFSAKTSSNESNLKFFVTVITDIKKGMETKSTFYLEDFKRYMAGDLPYEEYMKRFLSDVKGGQRMIGDEMGSHLEYRDIPMTEFLTKQIINRINFKFQRSDFPPSENFEETIVGITADTTRYYHFKGFNEVRLNNLRAGKKYIFTQEQLASFGEDNLKNEKPQGKLIHILFEDGQVKVQDEPQEAAAP